MSDARSPPGQRSGSHTPTTYHPAREWLDDDNEEEDEDMDYEPESERTEDLEFFDEEDDEEDDGDGDDPEGVHELFGIAPIKSTTPENPWSLLLTRAVTSRGPRIGPGKH